MTQMPQSSNQPRKTFFSEMLDIYGTPHRVIENIQESLKAHPIEGRLNLQVGLNIFGREEESFKVSCELLELAPQDPRVLFNHGWHWLKRGELQRGLRLLEFGRQAHTYGNAPISSPMPLWVPERGHNQTVMLALEGGYGDEIIHFRFVQNLAEQYGCKVHVVCQPALMSFFAKQSWVSGVLQKEAVPGVYHDSWLPGMSAAFALGLKENQLYRGSYLKTSPSLSAKWQGLLANVSRGKKLKVGLRWAGNPAFEHQMFRLFPPGTILDMCRDAEITQDVQFFSFQKDHTLQEVPESVFDLQHWLTSWEETAAALSQMDLVISSCTSCAHMSAALGVPTWVIVPTLPYFVWALPGDKTPWYDNVTVIRQQEFGNWESPRTEVKTRLSALLASS